MRSFDDTADEAGLAHDRSHSN